MVCGLSPRNGWNARLRSRMSKSAVPRLLTTAGAGELPRSQCSAGDHDGNESGAPSHCSTYTSEPGRKPDATTVNATGRPERSTATFTDPPEGRVMVVAPADS